MEDERTERAILKGRAAAMLLDDPLFKEAFGAVEAEIMLGWRNSRPTDTEGRERLFLCQTLLQRVRDWIAQKATDAKHLEAIIEAERQGDVFAALNKSPGEPVLDGPIFDPEQNPYKDFIRKQV